jgi:hypothetical protein
MDGKTICAGVKVIVVDSQGKQHQKIALSGVVDGYDIPVVWACREDEWQAAASEKREPDGVPWPAEDVRPCDT